MSFPQEQRRRASLASKLEELLKSRPGEWIPMADLAKVGGIGGWRTRLSELRLERDMRIDWNGKNGAASCHRFLPYAPLGRSADVPKPDAWPAMDAPIREPWSLT